MSLAVATTASVPTQPAPQNGQPPRDAVAADAPTGNAQQAVQPDAATTKAPAPPTAIGFTLTFDAATQRLILEARDPISGFVIYQMPPKYVIKQLSASQSVPPARGAKVDSAV